MKSNLYANFSFMDAMNSCFKNQKHPSGVKNPDLFSAIGQRGHKKLDFPLQTISFESIGALLSAGCSPKYRWDISSAPATLVPRRSVWSTFFRKCFLEAVAQSGRKYLGTRRKAMYCDRQVEAKFLPAGQRLCGLYRLSAEDSGHAWNIARLFLRYDAALDESV